MQLQLDYFYGNEGARFHFYRMPKALLDSELSLEAATLYGLMLDRVSLSVKNGWVDSLGRVFIYFAQVDVQKRLRCGHNRATAFMRELEHFGLIERKRQGLGKPAMIYVKNLSGGEAAKENAEPAQSEDGIPAVPHESAPVLFSAPEEAVQTARSRPSRAPETGSPDCPNRAANQTEKNETERSETHPILPQPPRRFREASRPRRDPQRQMDAMGWTREEIRENIDYEGLLRDHPDDRGLFDGYVELMTEVCCSQGRTVRVSGQDVPAAAVRSRLLQLERDHILYVRDCLCSASAVIGNIRAYTLAALYNAPVTMGQYYASLVSRDMAP